MTRMTMMLAPQSFSRAFYVLLLSLLLPAASGAQTANPSSAVRLTGRIIDRRGDAISGARVTVTSSGGASHATTTDSDGRFAFASLPASEYELRASADGFSTQTQRVIVPDEGLTHT